MRSSHKLRRPSGLWPSSVGLWLAVAACGLSAEQSYEVRGIVRSLDGAEGQIRIQHEDIPGFMPAMTMSFDVVPVELLEGVEPGMRVHFRLERRATTLRLTALEVVAGASGPVPPGPELPGERDPAPGFELLDQQGRPVSLTDLRGSAVLLDFVFTRCEGPCPILTADRARLQRQLSPQLKAHTHFVSISLDPGYDTPERLRAYGENFGADFEHWSFLTGSHESVQKVVQSYHVGSLRRAELPLDHVVATFLIDAEGRIARRYLGLEHAPEKLLADLQQTLGLGE